MHLQTSGYPTLQARGKTRFLFTLKDEGPVFYRSCFNLGAFLVCIPIKHIAGSGNDHPVEAII